jgi:phage-related protein
MPAVDGSITIDTKINEKGINAGVKTIGNSLGGILGTVKKIGKSLSTAFLGGSNIFAIIKSLAKFTAAAFIGGSIINSIRGLADSFDLMSSSVGEKIKPLNDALTTLKGTFVNLIVTAFVPLIPHLIVIVQWLTTMLQTVTQLVAALFGYKETVGNIMTTAAANAKKAAKEARGALAAFDQINVLQKQQAPDAPSGPTATPGPLQVSDELLAKIDALKEKLLSILVPIIEKLQRLWEYFMFLWDEFWNSPFGEVFRKLWELAVSTWKKMLDNVIETAQRIWEGLRKIFEGVIQFLVGVFRGDWELAWEGLKNIVTGIFDVIAAIVTGIINHILIVFEGMANTLKILLEPLITALAEMWQALREKIQTVWNGIVQWFFENVWNPIEAGFGSALTGIKQGFEKTFNGIKTFVRGIINTVIDYINGMIEGIVFGINSVIGAANAVGSLVGLPEINSVTAPQIPRLATGGVIPPNAEFLAVLGDQRSGKNIEAPESLIRQIVREEVGGMQAEISIRFEGDLSALVRQLKPVIDRENIRVGNSLAKGVVKI